MQFGEHLVIFPFRTIGTPLYFVVQRINYGYDQTMRFRLLDYLGGPAKLFCRLAVYCDQAIA